MQQLLRGNFNKTIDAGGMKLGTVLTVEINNTDGVAIVEARLQELLAGVGSPVTDKRINTATVFQLVRELTADEHVELIISNPQNN